MHCRPSQKQSALVGFLHSVLLANLQSPSFVLDPINFGSVGSLGEKTSHTCEADLGLTLEKRIWFLKTSLIRTSDNFLAGLSPKAQPSFCLGRVNKTCQCVQDKDIRITTVVIIKCNAMMCMYLEFAGLMQGILIPVLCICVNVYLCICQAYPRDPHPCGDAHLLAGF